MPFPQQSIQLTGPIGTTAESDTFPTHLDSLGKGGLRSVDSFSDLASIPEARRAFGMEVFCVNENEKYRLSNIAMGGNTNLLSDDSNWLLVAEAKPPTVVTPNTTIYTTSSLLPGQGENFSLSISDIYSLLTFSSSAPCWIRIYGSSIARATDTRTSPGGLYPPPGSDFYAELVTLDPGETIKLSPIPLIQADAGVSYIRLVNTGFSEEAIEIQFSTLSLYTQP